MGDLKQTFVCVALFLNVILTEDVFLNARSTSKPDEIFAYHISRSSRVSRCP